MGLLDILGMGGTKLERLQKAVLQKFGPPEGRQKALNTLVEMDDPEAIVVLIKRFTIQVDPGITDREEKEFTLHAVLDKGTAAVEPLQQFLRQSDTGVVWALKALHALVTPPEVVTACLATLEKLGNDYTRDPEKKVVLLSELGEHSDDRIPPALVPFLEDPSDDVQIHASRVLSKTHDESVRVALLETLVRNQDKKRVAAALLEALAEGGFKVDGYQDKVASLIVPPFALEKDGTLKRK